jgi:hypothetical protein
MKIFQQTIIKETPKKKAWPVCAKKLLEYECFKKKYCKKSSTARPGFNILEFQKYRATTRLEQKFIYLNPFKPSNKEIPSVDSTDVVIQDIQKLKGIRSDINLQKYGPATKMN